MAGELFINGRLVDISQDAPFPLTFNISDIKDLNARKGNKSKTITLPGTKNNTALMLSVYTLSSTDNIVGTNSNFVDFDPSVKAECQYYQDGLLEFNGVAQLMSCKLIDGVWSFEITLVSDTIDYISRLTKIKINELGYSEYNHALTYANQQDTWNGTIQFNGSPVSNQDSQGWKGKGYYYGLIDYGFTRSTPSTFEVEQIPPQVFCYDILTRAFNYCGITWNSRFLESQRFKRMLMTYPGGDLPTITQVQADNDSLFTTENNNLTTGAVINGSIQGYSLGAGSGFWLLNDLTLTDFYNCTVNQDLLSQAQTTDPLLFIAASEGLFNINYVGDHDLTFDTFNGGQIMAASYQVKLMIYKNNILISNDVVYSGQLNNNAPYSISYSFDYSRQINVLINDAVTFNLEFNLINPQIFGGPTNYDGISIEVISNTADLNVLKQAQSLTAGGTVYLDAFLPDMTCDVFFKGLVTAFNLYVKPSVADPTILEIEPLSDFYRSSGDAIDWTYKLDRSKEIQIEPTINFSAKNYKFNFETDDDYWNGRYFDDVQKQYGSFIVESQSQFATNETNFKLPFSQKLLSTIPDTSPGTFTDLTVPRVFQIKFNEDGTSLVERKKGKPFLVQLGGLRTGDWIHVEGMV